MGRRDPCRRGHGNRPRVLRRRRSQGLGSRPRRQVEGVLEVVRGVQGHARPAARDRQADARARERNRRRRRQRAADGVRPRRDGRRRLHPARRARARLRAGGRRDPVAADHGRGAARPRARPEVRADPGRAGCRVGARQLGGAGGRARREGGRGRREASGQAPGDDEVREAAAELVARRLLARDRRPRARLARAVDAERRGEGGDRAISESLILVERDEPIAVVLLNRPKQLNALSTELMDELGAALKELDAADSIRAIVLGGNERAFAAGADIDELSRATPIDMYYQRGIDRWEEIRNLWTPLVAAVSDYCLGGGCELALTCDIVIASETAQLGQPETNLGIIPGAGGTQR